MPTRIAPLGSRIAFIDELSHPRPNKHRQIHCPFTYISCRRVQGAWRLSSRAKAGQTHSLQMHQIESTTSGQRTTSNRLHQAVDNILAAEATIESMQVEARSDVERQPVWGRKKFIVTAPAMAQSTGQVALTCVPRRGRPRRQSMVPWTIPPLLQLTTLLRHLARQISPSHCLQPTQPQLPSQTPLREELLTCPLWPPLSLPPTQRAMV